MTREGDYLSYEATFHDKGVKTAYKHFISGLTTRWPDSSNYNSCVTLSLSTNVFQSGLFLAAVKNPHSTAGLVSGLKLATSYQRQ
jgi:hypothetical protein